MTSKYIYVVSQKSKTKIKKENMNAIMAELIGTCLLVLLGDGVVANVVLKGTKGSNSGWIVITTAWAFAVFVGVIVAGPISGAHLNPAVTVGLAIVGKFDGSVAGYIAAQMAGGFIGAVLVWLMYKDHIAITEDKDAKLSMFCTMPAIRNTTSNLISEIIGTFVLMFAIFYINPGERLGTISGLSVAFVILVIGLGLGGTTGYAINPARDLSPRVVHALLVRENSDWKYSWVPVVGPMVGACLAAALYMAL